MNILRHIKLHIKRYIIIAICLLFAILCVRCVFEPSKIIIARLKKYDVDDKVIFSDLTPFDWDTMYYFSEDYYIGDQISKTLGFHAPINSSDNPAPIIVFSKDNRFVYGFHNYALGAQITDAFIYGLSDYPDQFDILSEKKYSLARSEPLKILKEDAIFVKNERGDLLLKE